MIQRIFQQLLLKFMEKVRIQKIIADSGLCSRRKAEELIERVAVKVNGHLCKLGDKALPGKDIISVNGENIDVPKKKRLYYIMLNKPRGYVTTTSDELGRKCVTELLADVPERVYPIGRLDKDSEGMLLFTNDGGFANDIMHPSRHISKTYRVTVRPDVSEQQLVELASGDRRQENTGVQRCRARQAGGQGSFADDYFRGQEQADKENVRGGRS